MDLVKRAEKFIDLFQKRLLRQKGIQPGMTLTVVAVKLDLAGDNSCTEFR